MTGGVWSFDIFLYVAAVPECEVRHEFQPEAETFTAVHAAIIAAAVSLVVIIAIVAVVCIAKRR